jgi:hypothetical protein
MIHFIITVKKSLNNLVKGWVTLIEGIAWLKLSFDFMFEIHNYEYFCREKCCPNRT